MIRFNALPDDVREHFVKAHTTEKSRVQYNSFTSFTTDVEEIKQQFGVFDDTWVIRVQSPKHLRNIDAYTVKKGAEHLAPLMEQYEVVSVDKAKRTIDMKEIPDEEKKTDASQFASAPSDFKEFSKMMGDYRRDIQNGIIPRPVLTEDEQLLADHMQYG